MSDVRTHRRHVVHVPYDPRWPADFEEDAALLADLLGDALVRLHHIGSTSVPGLMAKPIVDVLGEFTSYADVEARRGAVENAGLLWRGEFGIAGRRYVVRDRDHVARSGGADLERWPMGRTNIHLFPAGHDEVERHLVFRDVLRADEAVRDAYAALKTELRARLGSDVNAYADAKSDFVASVLARGRP